ncbi:cadmium transporter [Mycobacterium sp. 852013-50091_SCH5140682]|uniref:cadmium resistance transporter n=1 Tax=Mycobacterium sp. 852013-50091_SCH5140682 TaxID=1834109 RepID=UPI0007EB3471|nr:cadmium resistance transporter [Mycobacterium sp. 852013-50091_SCH5140682]OBC12485.1 cadmium transporter [Mycobacterium sp. 852013-50091_SCH5140682]
MFAVTNVDDLVMLTVFFGRAEGGRAAVTRVVAGQYLGFSAIVAVSVLGALGATLLPEDAVPYLGLLPVALGVRAGWLAWRSRHDRAEDVDRDDGVGVLHVAVVTFANGGDNIGVYVPVFAVAGIVGYVAVFLVGVAIWCAAGYYLAARPAIAAALSRWGHIILPVILIGIGLRILVEGNAFGL